MAKKRLKDDERIRIAVDRFAPLKEGRRPAKISELAEKYDRDPAVITRAIQGTFHDGLVWIASVELPTYEPKRVQRLENILQNDFGLKSAIVIEVSDPSTSGDRLHNELGYAAAKHLFSSGTFFRDGDHIALSSGRGCYAGINALRNFPPLRAKDVTLSSLTGAMFATHDRSSRRKDWSQFLDGDTNLILFSLCFADPFRVRPISHQIAAETEDEANRILGRIWLGDPNEWQKGRTPNHAIIGVGPLAPGHRFYDEVERHETSLLEPIRQELEEIVVFCKKIGSRSHGTYWPVADLCNRLFICEEPEKVVLDKALRKEVRQVRPRIEKAIKKVNSRLVTVREDQLAKVQEITIIAGTKRKALAIRELLRRQPVRYLCTDSSVAEEIVRLKS